MINNEITSWTQLSRIRDKHGDSERKVSHVYKSLIMIRLD